MIPQAFIQEWYNQVPWQNMEMVEQDLIISRSIFEIYSDWYLHENLAFRGGTALHKLFFPRQLRYSEDIDLVQIESGPIKKTIDHLRDRLSFLGNPMVKQKTNNNTLIFRYNAELSPFRPMRLKIEINCREHFTVMGYQAREYVVNSRWFTGQCRILTYHPEEMLASKLRALYQRKKGRDLFDLYKALTSNIINTDLLIMCYRKYISFVTDNAPTQREFMLNMEEKMNDPLFHGDIKALLRPDENYDPFAAWEVVKSGIISKL